MMEVMKVVYGDCPQVRVSKVMRFLLARISHFEVRASFELTLWTQTNGIT